MPRLSVYFIRASLIYLVVGFTFGGLLLANKAIAISPAIWALLPIHIEFAFTGWMIQLAMGVTFWILPRFSSGPPRGNEWYSWLAFILVNMGILAVLLQGLGMPWTGPAGRILETLAVAAFVTGNWKRVKPQGA